MIFGSDHASGKLLIHMAPGIFSGCDPVIIDVILWSSFRDHERRCIIDNTYYSRLEIVIYTCLCAITYGNFCARNEGVKKFLACHLHTFDIIIGIVNSKKRKNVFTYTYLSATVPKRISGFRSSATSL